MVYRMQLTYDEVIDLIALKHIPSKITTCSSQPGIFETAALNKNLENILPDKVKGVKNLMILY